MPATVFLMSLHTGAHNSFDLQSHQRQLDAEQMFPYKMEKLRQDHTFIEDYRSRFG